MQHTINEIDKLYRDVVSYRSTKDFHELLRFIKKFRKLAPYNAMLLHIQKPGSEFVASAYDWKNKFNREINPGARPLLILQPFGPVAFVYEYNDTHGHELPKELVEPFNSESVLNEADLKYLIDNIKAEGIKVVFENYGSNEAGYISYYEDRQEILNSKYIYYMNSFHIIVVNSNLSTAEKYATILHELGHLYCGHLPHNHSIEKWLPERFDLNLSKEVEEFEAETVCWLICERMGIDNPSKEYLSGYLKNNKEIPNVSIDTILKAAGTIENFTKSHAKIRKELIIDKIERE